MTTYIDGRFWISFAFGSSFDHRRHYLFEVFRQRKSVDIFEQRIGRRDEDVGLELVEQCRMFLER